jgi:hypothetical protein
MYLSYESKSTFQQHKGKQSSTLGAMEMDDEDQKLIREIEAN